MVPRSSIQKNGDIDSNSRALALSSQGDGVTSQNAKPDTQICQPILPFSVWKQNRLKKLIHLWKPTHKKTRAQNGSDLQRMQACILNEAERFKWVYDLLLRTLLSLIRGFFALLRVQRTANEYRHIAKTKNIVENLSILSPRAF